MSNPAKDLREALAAVLDDSLLCWTYNGTHSVFSPARGADAVLARFEVRPRGTVTDAEVEAAARSLVGLGPDRPWPTNEELGGSPNGTRDVEYREGLLEGAREALEAARAARR